MSCRVVSCRRRVDVVSCVSCRVLGHYYLSSVDPPPVVLGLLDRRLLGLELVLVVSCRVVSCGVVSTSCVSCRVLGHYYLLSLDPPSVLRLLVSCRVVSCRVVSCRRRVDVVSCVSCRVLGHYYLSSVDPPPVVLGLLDRRLLGLEFVLVVSCRVVSCCVVCVVSCGRVCRVVCVVSRTRSVLPVL